MKLWSITDTEIGYTIECRSLRRLLWVVYEPLWFWKLRQPIVDYFDTPIECRRGKHKWFSFDYPDDDFEECSGCGRTRSWF